MKKLNFILFVFLFVSLVATNKTFAQLVSGEVFLQGDYVEVGIAKNGSFGTDGNAPSGYHPRGVGTLLGFVADVGKDGWSTGSPNYAGDYFLPGSPQEGWDVQVGTNWAKAWRGSGGTSFTGGLTGSCTDYVSSGSVTEGSWEGSVGDLGIKAVTTVKKDKLFFVTVVTLINNGVSTLKDIYYDRTVDPDQDVATPGSGGSFVTNNKVLFALPNPDNKSLVSAIGSTTYIYS